MVKSDMLKFLKWFCEVSISLKKDTARTAKTLLKMSSTIKALATGTIAETIDCKLCIQTHTHTHTHTHTVIFIVNWYIYIYMFYFADVGFIRTWSTAQTISKGTH